MSRRVLLLDVCGLLGFMRRNTSTFSLTNKKGDTKALVYLDCQRLVTLRVTLELVLLPKRTLPQPLLNKVHLNLCKGEEQHKCNAFRSDNLAFLQSETSG